MVQGAEEAIQQLGQLVGAVVGGLDHVGQLLKGDLQVTVALGGSLLAVAVQGQAAGDGGEEGLELLGLGGRDAVPGAEVGVVDTLLGVGTAFEDIVGQAHAEIPVLVGGGLDGLLVAGVVEGYDSFVGQLFGHGGPPFGGMGVLS